MNRIDEIVSFIDDTDIVADIGCDQAEVGISLARKNKSSYGYDISEKVISKAKDKIYKLGLNDYIYLDVCDGLDKVNDNVDTLVLAGMGSYTIVNIIEKSKKKFNKIITVSNTDYYYLRCSIVKIGYIIKTEKIIYDKNRYYNLIIFIPGKYEYSEKELILGYNIIKNDIYYDWINYIKNKCKNIQIKSSYTNKIANKIIKYLDND